MPAFPTSTTVLDSILFRDAFGTPAMREVFSDFRLIGRYAEIESWAPWQTELASAPSIDQLLDKVTFTITLSDPDQQRHTLHAHAQASPLIQTMVRSGGSIELALVDDRGQEHSLGIVATEPRDEGRGLFRHSRDGLVLAEGQLGEMRSRCSDLLDAIKDRVELPEVEDRPAVSDYDAPEPGQTGPAGDDIGDIGLL